MDHLDGDIPPPVNLRMGVGMGDDRLIGELQPVEVQPRMIWPAQPRFLLFRPPHEETPEKATVLEWRGRAWVVTLSQRNAKVYLYRWQRGDLTVIHHNEYDSIVEQAGWRVGRFTVK